MSVKIQKLAAEKARNKNDSSTCHGEHNISHNGRKIQFNNQQDGGHRQKGGHY